MSVILPVRIFWNANRSTSFSFFIDALRCIDVAPQFKREIELLMKMEVDTITLEEASLESILDFERLVQAVIERNTALNGSDFNDPSYFPSYVKQLNELLSQTRRSIQYLRATQAADGDQPGEHS